MKRILFAAGLMLAASVASASELPKCDNAEVRHIFENLNGGQIGGFFEIKEQGADDRQRWCHAYYVSRSFMEADYTLEWTNEPKHQFWLQIRASGRTSRYPYADLTKRWADAIITKWNDDTEPNE